MKSTRYQMVYQASIQWAAVSPQHMGNKKIRPISSASGGAFSKIVTWGSALTDEVDYRSANLNMNALKPLGDNMKSDELSKKLLAAEALYMRNQIVDRLCRWHRCRDDRDLLLALGTVEELVGIEDGKAAA